jgi:hypothetical protein
MSADDFAEIASKVLSFAMKAKKQMIERGVTAAHKTCSECGGRVDLVLAGRRQHVHMACRNRDCFMRCME